MDVYLSQLASLTSGDVILQALLQQEWRICDLGPTRRRWSSLLATVERLAAVSEAVYLGDLYLFVDQLR